MSELLHVSSSPHVRSKVKTDYIMLMVIIALMPATCFGIYNFGLRALMVVCISIATCVLTEWGYEKLMKKPITIGDLSAVVTGLLLGINLPVSVPWWLPIIGGIFAILVVKQLFGGLGQNIMNPALGARCFLVISFTGRMTDFSVPAGAFGKIAETVSGATPEAVGQLADTVSGATPLTAAKATGAAYNVTSMLVGNIQGTIGETSAIALLIGAIFLVCLKIIDLRVPLAYLGSFVVFIIAFGGHGLDANFILGQLFGGGLMLGAWFMATDYVTTPITKNGQLLYGVLLGVLTGIFRMFGASAEGVSYAIIFSNLLVPLIERITIPTAFGKGGKGNE